MGAPSTSGPCRRRTSSPSSTKNRDSPRKIGTVPIFLFFPAVGIAGGGDAVQVMLPHVQVALARDNRRVLHVELFREFLDRAPAGVGVLDVGLGMQLEELELVLAQPEQPAPAAALHAEPAAAPELALAV